MPLESHKRKRHEEEEAEMHSDPAHVSSAPTTDDETRICPDEHLKKDSNLNSNSKRARKQLSSRNPDPESEAENPPKDSDSEPTAPSALPPLSRYLTISNGGTHWHARRSFQNIVVFGDSYSKSYEGDTWVDHVRQRIENVEEPKLLKFAFPGAIAADDLTSQLSRFFLALSSSKETTNQQTRTLDPDRTIYFMFFGINDCGTTDEDELDSIVETIFDALHDLYIKAGARNFVLFDVLPVDRSPQAITSSSSELMQERIKTWNDSLRTRATSFAHSYSKATTLLFSVHGVLTNVLDDPAEYEFSEDDVADEGGEIWGDELHLTEEVHGVVAREVVRALIRSSC